MVSRHISRLFCPRFVLVSDKDAYGSFDAQTIQIEEPYRFSRYPITNSQFQSFINAPDIADSIWWQGIPEKEKQFSEPEFPYTNHPRERVSWYQAIAFCRWLSDKLGVEVDLPHEYEWEVAARYPDSRKFPWGDEFELIKANTSEKPRIGQTTAVGMYPSGKNEALNLYDMSGNVWEWCRNKYGESEEIGIDQSNAIRVRRGGSWANFQDFARAAYRYDHRPDNRRHDIGFRVVVRRPLISAKT